VALAKYDEHLLRYRHEQICARSGVRHRPFEHGAMARYQWGSPTTTGPSAQAVRPGSRCGTRR
jgi:hypothetical protein